jgi:sigma-E factor negative regulatory protein RseB
MSQRGFVALLLVLVPAAGFAAEQTPRPEDAVGWLNLMAQAPSKVAFSGTYVHQYGGRMESSRVTHAVDGTGEYEKLVSLDGPAREIVRKNDDIVCYLPDAKLMKYDRKRARKFFPALLSNVPELLENYSPKLGPVDRVAGFDCQWVYLEAKDKFRFDHRFCAELAAGLLLRAMMISDKMEVLEQFGFTQLAMGSLITPEQIKSEYADQKISWQADNSALQDSAKVDSGWLVKSLPAGFKKVWEMKRKMSGKSQPVVHQVYSDGLASVSVFVESPQGSTAAIVGPVRQGNYNFFFRSLQNHAITVIGEVPQASLQLIGNSLTEPIPQK